jgi:ankyrin repeat protein
VTAGSHCGGACSRSHGSSALHFAASGGYGLCLACLVGEGAALDLQNKRGWSALHFAASHGHVGVCHVLVDAGALVGLRSKKARTALEQAQEKGEAEVVAYLSSRLCREHSDSGRSDSSGSSDVELDSSDDEPIFLHKNRR